MVEKVFSGYWVEALSGQFEHFHNNYYNIHFKKCFAFNFGFHF
jgi:hypothetical protein